MNIGDTIDAILCAAILVPVGAAGLAWAVAQLDGEIRLRRLYDDPPLHQPLALRPGGSIDGQVLAVRDEVL